MTSGVAPPPLEHAIGAQDILSSTFNALLFFFWTLFPSHFSYTSSFHITENDISFLSNMSAHQLHSIRALGVFVGNIKHEADSSDHFEIKRYS